MNRIVLPQKLGLWQFVTGYCFGPDRQSEAFRWETGDRQKSRLIRLILENVFNAVC